MAVTIPLDTFYGESASTVADKVRDLPANQGLNDNALWLLIDAEIASVTTAQPTKFRKTQNHDANGNYLIRHGNK